MSHINYASTIWDGCSKDTFKKLNSVHRRAAKQLIHNPNLDTDQKLKQLNLLPLEKHLEINKIIMVHKLYNEKAPPYLTKLIQKATPRYNSKNLIKPRSFNDMFDTSLAYSGSCLWNKLPNKLKNITSTKTFKNELCQHYHDTINLSK